MVFIDGYPLEVELLISIYILSAFTVNGGRVTNAADKKRYQISLI